MVLVVFLTAAIALLSVSLIDLVRGDSSRAAKATVSDAAFQAAEAGLDDYTSKLLDDNQYFFHDVALGESTRRASDGTLVAPGASSPTAWTFGTTWTYPNGADNWRSLTNGYEYNIQVTGPTSTAAWTDIIATGRKQGTVSPVRVIEKRLRPASIADFLMITNSDYTVGSGATTYGKIYAGIDSSGTKHRRHPQRDGVRRHLRRGPSGRVGDDDERRAEVRLGLDSADQDDAQAADQLHTLLHVTRRHPAGSAAQRHLSEQRGGQRLAAHVPEQRHRRRLPVLGDERDELDPRRPAARTRAAFPRPSPRTERSTSSRA